MDYGGGFLKDEAVRLRGVFASAIALIGLAAPAHADPDPDASFRLRSTKFAQIAESSYCPQHIAGAATPPQPAPPPNYPWFDVPLPPLPAA